MLNFCIVNDNDLIYYLDKNTDLTTLSEDAVCGLYSCDWASVDTQSLANIADTIASTGYESYPYFSLVEKCKVKGNIQKIRQFVCPEVNIG